MRMIIQEGDYMAKKKKTFVSLYKQLIEEGKELGKKPSKFALKFAKAVDEFKQAQIDANLSIWDVYCEGRN